MLVREAHRDRAGENGEQIEGTQDALVIQFGSAQPGMRNPFWPA